MVILIHGADIPDIQGGVMPQGDGSKKLTFEMWKRGVSLKKIQDEINRKTGAEPESVKVWIRDWERGKQSSWTPDIDD